MKILTALLYLVAITAFSKETNKTSNAVSTLRTNVDYLQIGRMQEPKGSMTSWIVTTNSDNQIVFHMHNDTSGSNWIVYGGAVPIPLPYIFNDSNSGIHFRVEKDGRHITAIDSGGKTLWRRDPFADAHLEFYRTDKPRIVHIGRFGAAQQWIKNKGSAKFILISYNSSQFGVIDVESGDFTFAGQD